MLHVLKVIGEHIWVPLFLLVEIVGICMIPLDLPGNWVQFVAALLATLLTTQVGLASFPWPCTAILLVLAVGSEILDSAVGNRGLKRASGSRLAKWFAFFGGFGFGLLGAFVPIPIPVIGSLIGSTIMSFLGTFSGAIFGEWIHRRRTVSKNPEAGKPAHLKPALRVGTGVVIARVLGVAAKLWFAFLAFGVVVAGLVWDLFFNAQ